MHRILTFFVTGLVGLLLIGTAVAQQLAAGSLEPKPAIAARPKAVGLHQMTGTVKGVDLVAQTFNIKNRRGEENFSITPGTQLKKGRVHLKLAELRPGTEVTVKYRDQEGKKQASIIKVNP